MPSFLDEIERRHSEWESKNFPPEAHTLPLVTLGVCEEAGELAHAVLKWEAKIRGSEEVHRAEAIDAVGDITMYLMGVCRHLGVKFSDCIIHSWNEIEKRDWVKNPDTGDATSVGSYDDKSEHWSA